MDGYAFGQDLEFIPLPENGGVSSAALDINESNVVVGYSGLPNGYAAFRWTVDGGMELLPFPKGVIVAKAVGINSSGVIAGWAPVTGGTLGLPLAWRPDGTLVDLSFLSDRAIVQGITESGVIFGSTSRLGPCTFGTIDAPLLQAVDAGTLVSAQGEAILGSTAEGGRPLVIQPDRSEELSLPTGFTSSVARGMSPDGVVVGSASFFQYPSTRHRPFIWSLDGEPIQLPMLAGSSNSRSLDRNSAGRTVGYATGGSSPGCSAWVADGGSMLDAESLVDLPAGIELCDLSAINESGWMVGRYGRQAGSSYRFIPFVLKPVNSGPPCPADIDGDGVVGPSDLGVLLSVWGTGTSGSDLDGDGVIGSIDLGILLAAWGQCTE